jgi:hypothetical protein
MVKHLGTEASIEGCNDLFFVTPIEEENIFAILFTG